MYKQVVGVTRGKAYEVIAIEGHGDCEDITIIDDNGNEQTLGDFFFEEVNHERFKVLKNGRVVSKYTEKQLAREVQKYANEDGCVHYILKESDGAITQTCDPWINWQDINEYVKSENAVLLRTIEPKKRG
jgi:hypothetical protein